MLSLRMCPPEYPVRRMTVKIYLSAFDIVYNADKRLAYYTSFTHYIPTYNHVDRQMLASLVTHDHDLAPE